MIDKLLDLIHEIGNAEIHLFKMSVSGTLEEQKEAEEALEELIALHSRQCEIEYPF